MHVNWDAGFLRAPVKKPSHKLLRRSAFLRGLQLVLKSTGSFLDFHEQDGCWTEPGISEAHGTRQASRRGCLLMAESHR